MLPINDFIPGFSVDCVIFGFHAGELKVLLLKMKNWERWALPGGFIEKKEDVDQGAHRVLQVRTGLDQIQLQQFYLFGKKERNAGFSQLLAQRGVIVPGEEATWFSQRFISLAYYSLVEFSLVKEPSPDYLSEAITWFPMSELPPLVLDHADMVGKAIDALREELYLRPVGKDLLPKEFTMPELQGLYEAVLGYKLDRRNFRRKMLSYDLLIDTGTKRTGGANKAPILYRFDLNKYEYALKHGLKKAF